MESTKLVELLIFLGKRGRRKIQDFYISPLLKVGSVEARLLHYLCNAIDFSANYTLKRSEIQALFFSSSEKPEVALRYTTANVLKAVRVFIYSHEIKDSSDNLSKDIFLHVELFKKRAERNLKSIERTVNKFFASQESHDENYHYWQYRFEQNLLAIGKSSRTQDSNLQQALSSLEYHFIENYLRLTVEGISRRKISQIDLPVSIFDPIDKWITNRNHELPIGIRLYWNIYKMLTEANAEAHYQEVKEILTIQDTIFVNDYKRAPYEYLMNQAIVFINQGKRYYAVEYLDYIQYFIEQNWFKEGDVVSPTKMLNLIVLGLEVGRISWTQEITKKFFVALSEDQLQAFEGLKNSLICFHQQEYDKALKALSIEEFKDVYFRIIVDKTRLKIFYELDDFEALETYTATFRKFIRRNSKLSQVKKKKVLTFISALLKIFKYKRTNKVKLNEIYQSIVSDYNMLDRDWLLQKCSE
ncbi:MAG: hypothetical protein AAFY71_19850 [Bacteroidota bacterium]